MLHSCTTVYLLFFFFNDTATTEIYTLSLHDALPISGRGHHEALQERRHELRLDLQGSARDAGHRHEPHRRQVQHRRGDRKSTRLNSSHLVISYAVFCLKKKKTQSSD